MDIQMPHVSGLELIERMKADEGLKATPVMAVTAYAAKGDEERIRDAGAEGYVSKPISVLKFVEAVAGLLEAAARRAAPEAEAAEAGDAAEAEGGAAGEPDAPSDRARESGDPSAGGDGEKEGDSGSSPE
jgi:DNA-binding response OmpR family regulator